MSTSSSFRLGADGIYRCDAFQNFLWQEHGFGTVRGNPPVDVTLRQIHSDRVMVADYLADREEEGDALITDVVRKSVGVRTADCVPVLLLDPGKRAVGAVHAGWRGTAAGIVDTAVKRMHECFRTDAKEVYAAIGPCIRECCYEVGPEVVARFSSQFPDWQEGENRKRKLDLALSNKEQLKAAGVLPANIFDSELCTFCQSEVFFSYRRNPNDPGRLISSIARLA